MQNNIRVGIVGYGNLARGAELALARTPDMDLVAIFSRRDGVTSESGTPVHSVAELQDFRDKIDILILCGGSANDLMTQAADFGRYFHVIDSFDNHAEIEAHFQTMQRVASQANKVAFISYGWDPGLFSLLRLVNTAALPQGKNYTFWGRGISQGHSNALRRLPGVADAKQYTVPKEQYLEQLRNGSAADISAQESHLRQCYVVLEDGADPAQVSESIRNLPDYFQGYEVEIHFLSQEELERDHSGMPHGGFVIRSGETAPGERALIEYRLQLDSNPNFTAGVIVAYARAAMRMAAEGKSGCFTIFDVPPAYLLPQTPEDIRHLL
ncbi:MAG: diaminopimelate dehydrogenase [Veillonellaceae bacterium]|nr:diaminopimelate dehydrogenase [Veillonellaceae bacterium]